MTIVQRKFIGGCLHGKWRSVDSRQDVLRVRPPRPMRPINSTNLPSLDPIPHETYNLRTIHFEVSTNITQFWTAFVLSTLQPEEAAAMAEKTFEPDSTQRRRSP